MITEKQRWGIIQEADSQSYLETCSHQTHEWTGFLEQVFRRQKWFQEQTHQHTYTNVSGINLTWVWSCVNKVKASFLYSSRTGSSVPEGESLAGWIGVCLHAVSAPRVVALCSLFLLQNTKRKNKKIKKKIRRSFIAKYCFTYTRNLLWWQGATRTQTYINVEIYRTNNVADIYTCALFWVCAVQK